MKRMSLGQIVDFCIAYNKIHDVGKDGKPKKEKRKKATQADWDALFG